MAGTLTWLGHSAFRIDTPGGKRVYVDPFLNGNPKCPEAEQQPERVDAILITHGHDDHYGDTVALSEKFRPRVVAPVELAGWLQAQGVGRARVRDPNKGGTVDADGVKVTLTDAQHSSSTNDDTYAGEPRGLIVELEDGTTLYFAGDTNVFGDMALIRRIYEPDVAVLPIGDHYTMGPREAAVALELLGVQRCVPCHWGTFGLLTGTPDALRELAPAGVEIVDVEPGELSRAVRERWLGATGRRIDEIVVEGEVELPDDTLVLDELDERALRRGVRPRPAGTRPRRHGRRGTGRTGASRGVVRRHPGGAS